MQLFKVKIPGGCQCEQQYIVRTVFEQFLAVAFELESGDVDCIEITVVNRVGKLSIDASFFQQATSDWLGVETLPKLPLSIWTPAVDGVEATLVESTVPVLFGKKGVRRNSGNFHLNLDVFGSAFFMLSRYEEMVISDRDQHGRFPATASIAFKAGFLDRPLINEYLEIFWACCLMLWPDILRAKREYKNFITCDVDWPFNPAKRRIGSMIRSFAKVVLRERDPMQGIQVVCQYIANNLGFDVNDSYRENISWIMDVNEKIGNKVAFYFIPHKTSELDTSEDFFSTEMRALFREINERGHELGLHPGYECFNSPEKFRVSVFKLKRMLKEEGVHQPRLGGRMHFLRWDVAKTPLLWEENGLDYDSSLTYADLAGFRCGICYEFNIYDIVNRKALHLKQKPLIVMESTIIASRYEGLGYSDDSLQRFHTFKSRTKLFGGEFVLLWHNSHFESFKDKQFYLNLIS